MIRIATGSSESTPSPVEMSSRRYFYPWPIPDLCSHNKASGGNFIKIDASCVLAYWQYPPSIPLHSSFCSALWTSYMNVSLFGGLENNLVPGFIFLECYIRQRNFSVSLYETHEILLWCKCCRIGCQMCFNLIHVCFYVSPEIT